MRSSREHDEYGEDGEEEIYIESGAPARAVRRLSTLPTWPPPPPPRSPPRCHLSARRQIHYIILKQNSHARSPAQITLV